MENVDEKTRLIRIALINRAKSELHSGESLLYVEWQHDTTFGIALGIILMIIGAAWFAISGIGTILGYINEGYLFTDNVLFGIFLTLLGLLCLYFGIWRAFLHRKMCYEFVSTKRLCIRGKFIFGIPLNKDFMISDVENVFENKKRIIRFSSSRFITLKLKTDPEPFTFIPGDNKRIMSALQTAISGRN